MFKKLETSWNKGKKLTEEHKQKLSDSHKGKIPWNKGKTGLQTAWNKGLKVGTIPWNKGKKNIYSAESIDKMRRANKGKHYSPRTEFKKGQFSKEKSHFWKGGISFEPYSVDWTKTLKISIRERDKYTCRICGKHQEDIVFPVHHIDYNKKNCNTDNLILLCLSCHAKTNINRNYWINYFNNIKLKK